MAVQKNDFEGCCTANILTSFGQSHTSEYGYSVVDYDKLWRETAEQVRRCARHGIVTAILTSEQTTAAKVLKDLGFIGTGPAKKDRHPEVTIELFYLHCQGWEEPAKPAEHQALAAKEPVAAPVAVAQPFAQARQANPRPERPRGPDGRWVAADFNALEERVIAAEAAPQKFRLYLRGLRQRYYVIRTSQRTGSVLDHTLNPNLATEYEQEEVDMINHFRNVHGTGSLFSEAV